MTDSLPSFWQRLFEAIVDAPARWACRHNICHTPVRVYQPSNDDDGTCTFCGKRIRRLS